HVHNLTASAADFPMAQRHQGADHAVERCDRVPEADTDAHRGTVRIAGYIAQATHRFADGAEAGTLPIWTRLSIARQPHHHQSRVRLRQPLPPQSPLLQRTRTEILDHDVGFRGEFAHALLALRLPHVDGYRFLVARLQVPPQRRAVVQLAPLAQRVTAIRRLNLDHLCA